MKQLGVELILANSPQAKGRVERMNGTLQDRLVKALRLEGINDLERANQYLRKTFLPAFNRRFKVKAASSVDMHRPLPRNLDEVLSWEHERVVQRDWTLSCQGIWYQLDRQHEALSLVGRKVIVRTLRTGVVQLVYRGMKLRYRPLPGRLRRSAPRSPRAKAVRVAKPTTGHPWRRYASGIGQGQRFWNTIKAQGRAARQASRAFRSASATLRPPSRPGMPGNFRANTNHQPKGTLSPEF
jgi:hypothetical protein